MWHLVQHDPSETVHLGTYEDYDRAKFVMINKQRFNSHCKYEIIHDVIDYGKGRLTSANSQQASWYNS